MIVSTQTFAAPTPLTGISSPCFASFQRMVYGSQKRYSPISHNRETTEIVSINPLIPQSWGIKKAGGYPQTPGRRFPALFFSGLIEVSYRRLDT
jgi:hypothetical protein